MRVSDIADSLNRAEDAKREERALRLAAIGTITGLVGAITGVIALILTIVRG